MRFSDQDLLQHTHLWQQMRYSMLCHAGPAMKWHSTYAATSRWSCLSSCSFNKFRKFSSAQWANRIFPSNLQDFFLWKIQVQPEKIPVVLAIHHKHRHGYKLHGSVRHCQSRVKWYYAQQSITRFQRRRRPGLVRRMSTHTVQMRRHMHVNYDIIHNLKTDHAWAWAHIARTLWAIPLSTGSHRAYFVSNSFEQSNSF